LLAQHLTGASRAAVVQFAARAPDVAWERAALNALLKELVKAGGIKMPQLAVPLRVAVTGRTQTPSIDAVLELVGRDTVLERVAAALARTQD
jgi:glutamyl-tRNA synthetase